MTSNADDLQRRVTENVSAVLQARVAALTRASLDTLQSGVSASLDRHAHRLSAVVDMQLPPLLLDLSNAGASLIHAVNESSWLLSALDARIALVRSAADAISSDTSRVSKGVVDAASTLSLFHDTTQQDNAKLHAAVSALNDRFTRLESLLEDDLERRRASYELQQQQMEDAQRTTFGGLVRRWVGVKHDVDPWQPVSVLGPRQLAVMWLQRRLLDMLPGAIETNTAHVFVALVCLVLKVICFLATHLTASGVQRTRKATVTLIPMLPHAGGLDRRISADMASFQTGSKEAARLGPRPACPRTALASSSSAEQPSNSSSAPSRLGATAAYLTVERAHDAVRCQRR